MTNLNLKKIEPIYLGFPNHQNMLNLQKLKKIIDLPLNMKLTITY